MRPPLAWQAALWPAAFLSLVLAPVDAQSQDWRIVPSVTLTTTYTDLLELPPAAARRGWILDVAPGVDIHHAGARLKFDLDYRLHNLYHPSLSRLDTHEQRLHAAARLEAMEKWLFIDARADIVQQARSPTQVVPTPGLALPKANRIETGVYQVAPHIRGFLSDVAIYQLRYNEATIRPDDQALPNTRVSEWTGRLKSDSASATIGWSLDLAALEIHNRTVGTQDDARVRATLRYAIQPGLHVSVSQGHESTDFAGAGRRSGNTSGVGFEWSPGERTQLAAFYEDRFFGSAHTFLFRHRTPRTAWRVTSTREAAVLPALLASGSAGSIESALADLISPSIRDPEARTRETRRQLETGGITATAVPTSGFLAVRPLLHETLRASVALLGQRNTVTIEGARSRQGALSAFLPTVPDATFAGDIRQSGITANWAHRLSPLTALNFGVTWLRTQGEAAPRFETRQSEAILQFTRRVGPRTTASLGWRHTQFESSFAGAGFTRSALFATLTLRP